jgi:thiamine biosynthesis lipoprotein
MTTRVLHRSAWTDEVMGTVASIHLIADAAHTTDPVPNVRACFDDLHDADRLFSTYRDDSQISRLRRGTLRLEDADERVLSVHSACAEAATSTGGLFDAWHRGWFDPTGYVKGWAAERAARRALEPLVHLEGEHAVGLSVGGDMQLFTAPGSDWVWRVGISDPLNPEQVAATVEVVDGAVATSGAAERGAHILDPRTGSAAVSVAGATVVADGLSTADVWATTAVVAGFDDLSWISAPGIRSGLVISPAGGIRRWAQGVEITQWHGSETVAF